MNVLQYPVDEVEAEDLSSKKALKRWVQEIKYYESRARAWESKGKKIIRRYKDIRSPREAMPARFNILWSNIQTMLPCLYSRTPKPDIERRFRDKDDVGRVTSQVLERSITFFINEEFNSTIKQAILDRLLPGRGTVWVRYEPHFKDVTVDENEEVADDGYQITDDVDSYGQTSSEADAGAGAEGYQEVDDEDVCWDYVHWEDFGHTYGRTWDEVDAGWRKVYMSREELVDRFGDQGQDVPLDYSPTDVKDAKIDETIKKATIYEIWCKSEKKAYWLHKDYEQGILDEQDDPLKLQEFWPFPKPLFATLANDDCLPTPDYSEYQDQAIEVDELTSRIASITKCVKVAGIYDASAEGVQRLLAEGVENQLIPVDQFAMLSEKGGLPGVMALLPMQDILQTLLGLYEARDKVKADLYEITGMSDIIRGASDPDETATAQTIKSRFGSLRLQAQQDDVQRFVRDLVKIGTEIIAGHFGIETIKRISGIKLFSGQEKALITANVQAKQQQASMMGHKGGTPMQGQPLQASMMPPPPLPLEIAKIDHEDVAEMMDDPTWEEVDQLLKNEPLLAYKIDIETDSTIKFDEEAEKQARIEFLQATSSFMDKAIQAPPEMAPLAAKMLQFGIRGFKVGKELESAFDIAIRKLEKKAENSQPPPNPEMMKVQAQSQLQQQKQQFDMQLEEMRQKSDQQKIAMDGQAEERRLQVQAQVDTNQAKLDAQNELLKQQVEKQAADADRQMDQWKAKLESETKLAVAQLQAKTQLRTTAMSKGNDPAMAESGEDNQLSIADLMSTVINQLKETLDGVTQAHVQLANAVSKPKQIIRDENGTIVGIH